MSIATRLWSLRWVRSVTGLALVVVPACALVMGLMPTADAGSPATAVQVLGTSLIGADHPAKIDPAAVAGYDSCTKCHKSEIAALEASKHHESMKLISGGANLAKYAEAVGISVGDITKNSICIQCHATPQGKGSGVQAAGSVSCESCHGGSVGNPEWLKLHATEGITDAQRKQCDSAGMIRSSNIYAIARNCAGCHLVFDEALVNAGHPETTKWDFELVGGSSGEVRHNFQVDQKTNAAAPSLWMKIHEGASAENRRRVKYLVGMLVDLEVTLGYLKGVSKSDGKKPFAKGHAKRLKSVAKDLKSAVKALGDNAPEELVAAHEAIEDIGRISSFNFKSQAGAAKAEPVLGTAARALSEKYDGSKLADLDKMIDDEVKPRGNVYSP